MNLRVGILLDSFSIAPAWMRRVLVDITETPGIQFVVAVENGSAPRVPQVPPVPRFWKRVTANPRGRGFSLYYRLDTRHRIPGHALEPVDISDLVAKAEFRMAALPKQGRFVDRFDDETLERIRRTRPDVLLRFGFRIIKGGILDCARFGVWSYHHGDNDHYRGGPACFWEIYEKNPVAGTVLQVLNERLDDGKVIYKSFSTTHPYSLNYLRNHVYWKSSAFVIRKLRQLVREDPEALKALEPAPNRNPRLFTTPRNAQALRMCGRMVWQIARDKYGPSRIAQWFLAYARRGAAARPSFKYIRPPADRFYADPFIVARGRSDFVFFEDYSYGAGKGVISCIEIDSSGTPRKAETVLAEPFHLSYPHVFEDGGHLYLIPESAEAREVRLYRCIQFPNHWELDHVLLSNVNAVDATIHHEAGMYWMFVNIPEPGANPNDELHLFHSQTLRGPWQPHPRNPIVSDVRCARMAGGLFKEDGVLHRVSQNGAGGYGRSMTVHAVEELSTTSYRERSVREILPSWLSTKSVCTHTLNMNERYVVTDGCVLRRSSRTEPSRIRS